MQAAVPSICNSRHVHQLSPEAKDQRSLADTVSSVRLVALAGGWSWAYVFDGMTMVLRRLLTLSLALAFLVGGTGQLMPSSMAAPQMTASADMGGCAGPQPPCTGHIPNCLDHGGCITVSALPASPTSIAVPVEWTSLDKYDLTPQALAGISVKPELSPPILAA